MKNIRYLKRLLVSIYVYLAVFDLIVLINFIITGNEPTTLVASVNAVVGVESIISGIIKLSEQKKIKTASADENLHI